MKVKDFFSFRTKAKSAETANSAGSIAAHIAASEVEKASAVSAKDFYRLFITLGEVSFPILYVTDRICRAGFLLKRAKDDTAVWSDGTTRLYGEDSVVAEQWERIKASPNAVSTWKQFVFQYFVNRYLSGNTYVFADGFSGDVLFSDALYVLRSDNVAVNSDRKIISRGDIAGIVKSYRFNFNGVVYTCSPESVLHTTDIAGIGSDVLKGQSRLEGCIRNIGNLVAAYEARNTIYTKRGPLGTFSPKFDKDALMQSMSEKEKESVYSSMYSSFGFGHGRLPYAVMDIPVDFMKTGATISELEPFRECESDAAVIAAQFNVAKELLPRESNTTFANQENAEVACYESMVIPEAISFAEAMTHFLGLDKRGYYIHPDFSGVSVLQKAKDACEDAKTKMYERALSEFRVGVITLNDLLASTGRERRNEPIYNKTLFQMTPEELSKINRNNGTDA